MWLRLCICRSAGKDVKDMHKIFGQREKGQYYDRSGAYLVIFSGGKTAVNVFQDIVDAHSMSLRTNMKLRQQHRRIIQRLMKNCRQGLQERKAPDMALLDTDKSRNLSEKNLVADINEYVEKDDSFEKDDYLPVFYEHGEDQNGKLFALPAYGTTQVMYYNKAAFEKAGIDPATIKTWQDLAAAAEKMTASDGSFVGWEPNVGLRKSD